MNEIFKVNLKEFVPLNKLIQVLTLIKSRYYNEEVYLVGSILTSPTPRDIDAVNLLLFCHEIIMNTSDNIV
jgi:hypothetical protein